MSTSKLNHNLHFCSFIADEEVGGHDGMQKYVVSKEFKDLNIGFALDEGLASEDNKIPLFYGERNVYWVKFKCTGKNSPNHSHFIFTNFFVGNPGLLPFNIFDVLLSAFYWLVKLHLDIDASNFADTVQRGLDFFVK